MARDSHGIKKAEFGTDGTSWTELEGINGDESQIEFLDQEGNAVDPYGNEYAGVLYAQATFQVQDETNALTVYNNWNAGTLQYFQFNLSNSAVWTWDYGTRLQSARPITIQGRVQGQSNFWEISVRIPYDDISKA